MSVKVRQHQKGGEVVFEVDIIVRTPAGKVRERSRHTGMARSAVKRWAEQRASELMVNGKPITKEVPTLEDFSKRYMKEHVVANRQKPSTQINKQSTIDFYLKPRFGHRKLDSFTEADVQRLKGELSNKAPKTVNNVLSLLSAMLKVAVEWGVIDDMPMKTRLLKVAPAEVAFYEPHEYERLVEAAKAIGDHRLLVFLLLGGDAGLRCGEIIAVEQTDVDLNRRVLHVRSSEWEGHLTVPKGGRGRAVVLTERLREALRQNRHLKGTRVLWRDPDEGKISQVLLAKWMRRIQRRAGLAQNGRLHILRHTFCSRLAMAGAPTMAIKELAGHKELSTTQRYMHLSPAAKNVAIELLDRGADLAAQELKEPTKRGNIVETESGLQEISSDST